MSAPLVETASVGPDGRLTLPKQFANATVTVELVGADEVRVRRAAVPEPAAEPPDGEEPVTFWEETVIQSLTERDWAQIAEMMENPPPANAALKAAAARYREWKKGQPDD